MACRGRVRRLRFGYERAVEGWTGLDGLCCAVLVEFLFVVMMEMVTTLVNCGLWMDV